MHITLGFKPPVPVSYHPVGLPLLEASYSAGKDGQLSSDLTSKPLIYFVHLLNSHAALHQGFILLKDKA